MNYKVYLLDPDQILLNLFDYRKKIRVQNIASLKPSVQINHTLLHQHCYRRKHFWLDAD